MGVERAVTRWHVQHQRITNQITELEARIAAVPTGQPGKAERANIEKQLASLRDQLQALGPCPKPMMG